MFNIYFFIHGALILSGTYVCNIPEEVIPGKYQFLEYYTPLKIRKKSKKGRKEKNVGIATIKSY